MQGLLQSLGMTQRDALSLKGMYTVCNRYHSLAKQHKQKRCAVDGAAYGKFLSKLGRQGKNTLRLSMHNRDMH